MKISQILLALLSPLILTSFLIDDTPNIKISKETEEYFKKEVLPSCSAKSSYQDYLIGFSFDQVKSNFSSLDYFDNYHDSLINNLKKFDCNETLVENLNKKFAQERFVLHADKLKKIKKEIDDFRSKNLPATFQLMKYKNYADKYLKGSDLLDPSVEEMLAKNQSGISTRRETCSDVMNLKEPLSLDRPKSQDSIGWCYAYAASDLIAHATGKNPSAVHIASLVNDKFLWRIFSVKEGGFITTAINEVKSEGVCLEENLPSDDYKFSTNSYDIKSFYDELISLSETYGRSSKSSTQDLVNEICLKRDDLRHALRELFPGLTISEVAKILSKSSGNKSFLSLVKKSCTKEKGNDIKSLRVTEVSGQDEIFKSLDKQLDSGNILGIGYKAETLFDYQNNPAFANHASTIVGRRFNPQTQSCEYLVRNTWGKSCFSYISDFDCKNGHVWVPEDYLKYNKSISSLSYVEKK